MVTTTEEVILVVYNNNIKRIWIITCDSVAQSACRNLLRARAPLKLFTTAKIGTEGMPLHTLPLTPVIIFKTELLMELAKVKQNAPPTL